jgi:regulatory protein
MDEQKANKYFTESEAYAKAEHYCAWQERSQQEARDKLYEWGMAPTAVEKGKFNQKGWGRIKIKQGLKFKKVPDVLIKKALLTIDGDDYLKILRKVLEKKAAVLAEKDLYKRKYKLQQYALSRGYEGDLVAEVLRELFGFGS